ncbi:MAG: hypothetical protein AB7U98_00755 [Candidatus Nitrosocosmicus sp.]|uniref:hypothetical protein n=1 Tax=Candidatus Nitrosocosmicus sp. FF01 TaxID=3397670 RepID=UPI002A715043|nr:hypothetical protein [Candidatus Nitrosocosmicus sp.]
MKKKQSIFRKEIEEFQFFPLLNVAQWDRCVLSNLHSGQVAATMPPVDIQDFIVYDRNRKNISIRIVRPADSTDKNLLIVMHFHNGGWVLGGIDLMIN